MRSYVSYFFNAQTKKSILIIRQTRQLNQPTRTIAKHYLFRVVLEGSFEVQPPRAQLIKEFKLR